MSARLTGSKRRLAVAVGVVALLAMGATAYAAIPNDDGNIYACYSNGDGSVRVHQDPAKVCPKNWSPLKWPSGQADVPVTTTYRKIKQFALTADELVNESVDCDDGDVATGGGFSTPTSSPIPRVSAQRVEDGLPVGWSVFLDNRGLAVNASTVSVICQHTE